MDEPLRRLAENVSAAVEAALNGTSTTAATSSSAATVLSTSLLTTSVAALAGTSASSSAASIATTLTTSAAAFVGTSASSIAASIAPTTTTWTTTAAALAGTSASSIAASIATSIATALTSTEFGTTSAHMRGSATTSLAFATTRGPLPETSHSFISSITTAAVNMTIPGAVADDGLLLPDEARPEDVAHCSLLSTPFGWWLQVFLGVVCFVSLVGKRFTDRVRRPWTVWFMDTSKQGLSAFLVHFSNIFLSMAFGRWADADADPCNWYWINLTLDDTFGIAIQFVLLKLLQCVYRSKCVNRPELADSGEYGDPPDWGIFARQLRDWQGLVLCQKVLMLVVVVGLTDQVAVVAEALLGWMDPWPRIKLVFVMVITPITMNVFALWMADNFLQGDPTAARTVRAPLKSDRGAPSLVGNPHGTDCGHDMSGDESRVVGFQEWKRKLGTGKHRHMPLRETTGSDMPDRHDRRDDSL